MQPKIQETMSGRTGALGSGPRSASGFGGLLPTTAFDGPSNRIGASRLQQISHILQVPVAFFFEGAPDASVPRRSHDSALSIAQIDDFVSESNGLRLIEAFMRIDNAALRRSIVMLVQEIVVREEFRSH